MEAYKCRTFSMSDELQLVAWMDIVDGRVLS